MEETIEDAAKFCPACGYEGNDVVCPVCNEKMESLDEEVNRVAELEKKKDVTEDAGLDDEVSLEEVAKEEEKRNSSSS